MRDPNNSFEPPCPVVYMMMTPEEMAEDDIRASLNIQRVIEIAKKDKSVDIPNL